MNAPLPAALSAAAPSDPLVIERVRHPLQARHLQVVRRTAVSPGFVRLTLAGPELAGFVSAGFDDHVKLILPHPGQERASLPSLQDGRPVFDGPRPVLRDYTPARHDAAAGELDIEVALHDAGPATDWAAGVAVGQWVGIAGPRGSMVVPTGFDWHWLVGDETALPAIARRLAELPAHTQATVRIRVRNPADQRPLASAARLDLQWVDALPAAVEALALPPGAGFVWAAGEHGGMAAVRSAMLAKPGVDAKRMRISSYWKRGAADFHE
jgi:ferric-chelate reductase (NADPH)